MNKHVKDICKIGQGRECCRYLIVGGLGFECAKLTKLKTLLDKRVLKDSMTAQGDNCKGYSVKLSIEILNREDKK